MPFSFGTTANHTILVSSSFNKQDKRDGYVNKNGNIKHIPKILQLKSRRPSPRRALQSPFLMSPLQEEVTKMMIW